MGFNTYIRDLRKDANLSQSALAKKLGVSITTIKNAEYGATNKPNSKFLNALSKFLNKEKIIVYRDIIFYSYYITTNYEAKPFVNLLTLYSSYRELESCEMNLPKNLISHNHYDHICVYHYYLKNPNHNVLVFDANYFFCNRNTYVKDVIDGIKTILVDKTITMETNRDVKSVEIVFDNSIKEEVNIFNKIETTNTSLLKRKIYYILFDKNKLKIINRK